MKTLLHQVKYEHRLWLIPLHTWTENILSALKTLSDSYQDTQATGIDIIQQSITSVMQSSVLGTNNSLPQQNLMITVELHELNNLKPSN